MPGTRVGAPREPQSTWVSTYLATSRDLEPFHRGLVRLGLAVPGLGLGLAHGHGHRLWRDKRRLRGETHGVDGFAETQPGDLHGRGEARGGHGETRHANVREGRDENSTAHARMGGVTGARRQASLRDFVCLGWDTWAFFRPRIRLIGSTPIKVRFRKVLVQRLPV